MDAVVKAPEGHYWRQPLPNCRYQVSLECGGKWLGKELAEAFARIKRHPGSGQPYSTSRGRPMLRVQMLRTENSVYYYQASLGMLVVMAMPGLLAGCDPLSTTDLLTDSLFNPEDTTFETPSTRLIEGRFTAFGSWQRGGEKVLAVETDAEEPYLILHDYLANTDCDAGPVDGFELIDLGSGLEGHCCGLLARRLGGRLGHQSLGSRLGVSRSGRSLMPSSLAVWSQSSSGACWQASRSEDGGACCRTGGCSVPASGRCSPD